MIQRPSDIFAAKQGEVLPTVHYDEVMSTDEALLLWLDKIVCVNLGRMIILRELLFLFQADIMKYRHGYSFVKGVPVDPESTKRLIERIAFIRHTHYGSSLKSSKTYLIAADCLEKEVSGTSPQT